MPDLKLSQVIKKKHVHLRVCLQITPTQNIFIFKLTLHKLHTTYFEYHDQPPLP